MNNKADKYEAVLRDVHSLTADEPNIIANLANTAAELHSAFHFFWVGFYLVEGDTLVLGPFQGPSACTRIAYGRGVCGTAWKEGKSIIVPNVHEFKGHIACSGLSESEIVVPLMRNGKVCAVLDVDSNLLNDFDSTDQAGLEAIAALLSE